LPVRLWRQFWLGGDDAYQNLIIADAEGIQAISTARRERFEDNAAQAWLIRLNLRRLSGTIYVAWYRLFANDGQQHPLLQAPNSTSGHSKWPRTAWSSQRLR
jgi:hypothetical protein